MKRLSMFVVAIAIVATAEWIVSASCSGCSGTTCQSAGFHKCKEAGKDCTTTIGDGCTCFNGPGPGSGACDCSCQIGA